MQDFLMYLVPVIVAALTEPLAEIMFKINTMIDSLPAWVKQLIVASIAYGVTLLAGFLGVSADDPAAIRAAGLTFIFHLGRKLKPS